MKPWIGFDLDGTLAEYPSKIENEIGSPIEPIILRLKSYLKRGYEVKIVTARVKYLSEIPLIEQWCLKHIGIVLEVTDKKDFAMLTLFDDRAVAVEVNTGKILGGYIP